MATELEDGDTELLFENKTTKNGFLDDVHELKEFISRRKVEVASEGINVIQVRCRRWGWEWGLTFHHDHCRWVPWMSLLQQSVG